VTTKNKDAVTCAKTKRKSTTKAQKTLKNNHQTPPEWSYYGSWDKLRIKNRLSVEHNKNNRVLSFTSNLMHNMRINDRIYGQEDINEPLLIDLINSKEIQRLKGISQQGMPQRYYHRPVYSRYEHSIGAMILLKKLGAIIEEQVGGLLHDASHKTFSHVIDWVLGDPTKEDYQDTNHVNMIENSQIPVILGKHGLNSERVSDLEELSLLDKPTPSLCVDRFDYSIREKQYFGDDDLIQGIVMNLKNHNGNMVFKSKEQAEIFARGYMTCQIKHWAGNEAKARYYLLSEVLKKALDKGIVTLTDFNKTDEYIITLLKQSEDLYVLGVLNLLHSKKLDLEESRKGLILPKKFRYIDPEVLVDNQMISLSELSPDYKEVIQKARKDSEEVKGIIIKGLEGLII